MKLFYRLLILSILSVLTIECARKGRPEGGPKDETAPIMVTAKPANESVNFDAKNIRIYFDEYIVLKDLTKQLVISPPLKNPPLITPQGTPSKYINIKILDTLQPNTTYTFNFGNAVQDNNENNKLENFKYVFSTGTYIDSLTTKGTINDALTGKLKKNVSILLYRLDSTYTDSIMYKQKPSYVANTADSLNFQFTNLKEGKYVIMGLDEENRDYIFNPKTDKIGFLTDTISLPKDSIITNSLTVFKEIQPYTFKRAKEVTKGKIEFGFEGKQTDMKVELLSQVPSDFKSYTQFEKEKDTLNYWHTPIDVDSLNFRVANKEFIDSVTVRLRKKKIDSLVVNSTISSTLHLNDTVFLTTNNPVELIDNSKISLFDKDTTEVAYELYKKEINKIALLFDKKPKNSYTLKVLPKAITDLYNTSNDTLSYKFSTKEVEDYGTIALTIQKETESPVIIQLLDKNKVIRTDYVTNPRIVEFTLLEPKEYTIRAIIDTNGNKVWDTGNFLQKIQPERIVYYTENLKLRANWSFNETFIIK
ncbi:Ig-like domain-containing protein [Tenacibaculum sp. IB213877]|uniref:Ig-like domain-containing protein n=1 Tax=Tenacibaculum sp. IB213877 TaxID=3097351 RepID=UPI002A5AE534|nr:Ig-like domain-containing protein [Tenacibaculum sp. IB213877]MDY0780617.1 Ig-like domain-containing protein [Tenacibaculum sp. IB213877]